jgi:predicted dehydrogenase
MFLTPEQLEQGRRGFLAALADSPDLLRLVETPAVAMPLRGAPVRLGFVGLGGQGRVLLDQTRPEFGQVRALCDINPEHLKKADEVLAKRGLPAARHYADWREMLEKEDLEAVVMAPPLWLHAEIAVGCLEAGKHVLCEKMMAWDVPGADRMREAARRARRVLEIGYQRFYNPMYQAAYTGLVAKGRLGEVHHARLVWHRNGNWKRQGPPPEPGYDPSAWGYPSWDHLLNWRLYWKYSQGLMAELGSHMMAVTNWFFGASPSAVQGMGGVYRFPEGREVQDHVFVTFDYPGDRTAVFTSIESNAFDHYYEVFMGTKGTLLLKGESEAYFFPEGSAAAPLPAVAAAAGPPPAPDRLAAYRLEVSDFCGAVRDRRPLRCGPDRAARSSAACIAANQAMATKARVGVMAS